MKVKEIKTSINEIFKRTKEGAVTEMHLKILEARGIKPLNVTDLWSWYNEWDEFVRYADHETDPKPSWEFPAEAETLFNLGDLAELELDTLHRVLYYTLYENQIKDLSHKVFDAVARRLLPNPLSKWESLDQTKHTLMRRMIRSIGSNKTLEEEGELLFGELKKMVYWPDFIRFHKSTRGLSESEQHAIIHAIEAYSNLRLGRYRMMVDNLVGVVKAEKGDYRQASEAIKEIILNCHI